MANTDNRLTLKGDAYVTGDVTILKSVTLPEQKRANLTQEASAAYVIPWTAWRVFDAYETNLPAAGANNDLGLVGGTWGTSNSPVLQTKNFNAVAADTAYARCVFALPPEYVADGSVVIRFNSGMITNTATTSATIDLVVYESNKEAGIGADLCTTGATTINSLLASAPVTTDFTTTDSGLVPGDILDMRVAVYVDHNSVATDCYGAIGYSAALLTIKG